MVRLNAEDLRTLGTAMLTAVGVAGEEAELVLITWSNPVYWDTIRIACCVCRSMLTWSATAWLIRAVNCSCSTIVITVRA